MSIKAIEDAITRLETVTEQAEAKRQAVDPRLSDAARAEEIATIDEWEAGEKAEIREQGRVALEKARLAAEADHQKRVSELGPRTAEEWQEANARDHFVAEDVEGMEPSEILRAYRAMTASGDRVGASLLERHASRRLGELGALTGPAAAKARAAAKELHALHRGDVEAKREKKDAELSGLRRELLRTRGTAEERTQTEDVRRRFGI